MHPDFNDTLSKSLEFSPNLILYIPRNTEAKEICSILSIYANQISKPGRGKEIIIEIERLGHQHARTSVLGVFTGELSLITNEEIADHMCEHYLNLPIDENLAQEIFYKL